ncbi:hypothetical protein HMN09_01107200 [Mycena chlorophos]|uniref:Uncharacterized protein n=1 Tax=Mycena chlorophos TaxID=658473 RepID=A0A8H6VYE3_MYCCL|nr:hypothetical protein HMN09_01107200 [Mycena chlorophos]
MSSTEEADAYTPKLCALPVLTHLCLNDIVPWETAKALLGGCRRLKVLLVLWSDGRIEGVRRAQEVPFVDDRFVMAPYADVDGSIQFAPNPWSRAEDFIKAKRFGRIEEREYWMPNFESDW